MPLLGDIYSYIDALKRKAADTVSNPVNSLNQFIGNIGDQQNQNNALMNQAGYGLLGKPTVSALAPQQGPSIGYGNQTSVTPQQQALARGLLAEQGSQMGMAGVIRNGQSTAEWAGTNAPEYIGGNHANDMMQILKEDIATKDFDPSGIRQGLIDWSRESNIHPRYALQSFIRNLNADKELSKAHKSMILQSMNP
jgi:hypothetical protein